MSEWVYAFLAIPVLLLGAAGVYGAVLERRAEAKRMREIAKRLGLEAHGLEVRGDLENFSVRLRAVVHPNGTRNALPVWHVEVSDLSLGARTTLNVGVEAGLSKIARRLNIRDVEIGDPAFDERFCVRADEPDVARAALCLPDVRAALEAIFDGPAVYRCQLDKKRVLLVRALRETGSVSEAEAHLRRAVALAKALHKAADVKPMPPPDEKPEVGALGPASGSPMGVPVVGEER